MKKLLLSASLIAFASSAHSAVVAYTWEEDGNVITEYSGSLDLSGLYYVSSQGRSVVDQFMIRSNRSFYFNMFDYDPYSGAAISTEVNGIPGGEVLGTGGDVLHTTRYGDQLGYGRNSGGGGSVYVAYGYDGAYIEGGSVTEGTTLAAMGITTPSSMTYSWSTDSITHYWGTPAPVPLPAGLPLLAAGIGAFAWMRRKA
jgi:opacity protein-like surface antigen